MIKKCLLNVSTYLSRIDYYLRRAKCVVWYFCNALYSFGCNYYKQLITFHLVALVSFVWNALSVIYRTFNFILWTHIVDMANLQWLSSAIAASKSPRITQSDGLSLLNLKIVIVAIANVLHRVGYIVEFSTLDIPVLFAAKLLIKLRRRFVRRKFCGQAASVGTCVPSMLDRACCLPQLADVLVGRGQGWFL